MKPIKVIVSLAWIGISVLLLVLTACSPSDELVLQPTTVVADEETEEALTSVTENQEVLDFTQSTPQLDGLEVGDVLVMGPTDHAPEGLLRKVTGIERNGGVVVNTEFATMEDAIEQGTIVVTATITAAEAQAAALGVEGVRVLQESEGTGFTVDLNRTIGGFTFSGQLKFLADPVINVELNYLPLGLKELEFIIETDESLNLQVQAEENANVINERVELLPHPIRKDILLLPFGFPVYVVIYFTPVLVIEGDLSGQLQARVEYEAQRKAGLHYENGSWDLIGEQNSDFNGEGTLEGQANFRASVGPEVEVKFYSVVGPTGNVFGYLEFESGWDSLLWWKLYGGLRAELGIEVGLPILGRVAGYGPVEVMHFRQVLVEYGEATKFHLTITSTAGGSVTTPDEGTFAYDEGTVVNLVATPDAGYRFVNWTGDVGTIANPNAASTTITMNGDYSITANFEEIPPVQYDLTISSTAGGSVTTPGEGTFTYNAGTVVDLVAEAEEGYSFVNWTGDVGTIANFDAATTNITMDDNYSITANFEQAETQLVITTPGSGTFTVPAGVTEITVEAWGAGGSGGGVPLPITHRAGGGGGGAYARKTFRGVIPMSSIPYYVAPETGVSYTHGYSGKASWFYSNNSDGLVAAGGSGGGYIITGGSYGGPGGSVNSSYGDVVYKGGDGAAASYPLSGAGGGGAGSGGNGKDASEGTPGGATEEYGGAGGAGVQHNGEPGHLYGGGGSGATSIMTGQNKGGAGAQGLIRVTWHEPAANFYTRAGVETVSTDGLGAITAVFPETGFTCIASRTVGVDAELAGVEPVIARGHSHTGAISTVTVNTTRAEKIAILGLLVLISVALAVLAKRRRGRGVEYT